MITAQVSMLMALQVSGELLIHLAAVVSSAKAWVSSFYLCSNPSTDTSLWPRLILTFFKHGERVDSKLKRVSCHSGR